MNYQHIYRLEKDRFRPRPKTMVKLAEVLGVSSDILMAAMEDGIPTGLMRNDPELTDLMAQITTLDEEKISALKTFLNALLTCQQVQSLAKRPLTRTQAP